jgi:glutamate-ammonia-ligase adenylyltransferase
MKDLSTPEAIRRLLETYSTFWPRQFEAHPDDLEWLTATLPWTQARNGRQLQAAWRSIPWGTLGLPDTFRILCQVKRREMLRITLRELADIAPLKETLAEISALADFCLQKALKPCLADMEKRHGTVSSTFAVIGLGKLGGEELNYSSDIDLIFLYSEEGAVGRISCHDFFTHLTNRLVEGLRTQSEEGSLFRVDLRLRPEGNAGPITRSLESYENYYAAFGEVWERMALQKARLVAGDAELGYEFIQHLQPFCYPRHLGASVLDEIAGIKKRIEAEILKEGGLERHVKLGKGGIREIEFAVQALQLLQGAQHPFIQERSTLKALGALNRLQLLDPAEVEAVSNAYVFLRRLEHRLQMREDRQTHTVPEDAATQTAIAKGLGFETHDAFLNEWKTHIGVVRAFFDRIVSTREEGSSAAMMAAGPDDPSATMQLADELLAGDQSELPLEPFEKVGFADPRAAARTMQTLARGPEYAHVSQRTKDLFRQLCPHLFREIRSLVRPDVVIQQFERFIGSYGSRSAIYEMLLQKPKLIDLLFKLFDHSLFLTDLLIGQPNLLEAIAYEGLLMSMHDRQTMEQTFAEETAEQFEERLLSFRNLELLRIGLRDILGLASSPHETHREISLLADLCLAKTFESLVSSDQPSRQKFPSLSIIALGKYGSLELTYGGDLDVLFVGGTIEEATRIVSTLAGRRGGLSVFKIDARLRPDGSDGPLALPLEAYERYYQKRAQFWERQALTRARFAAGDPPQGKAFLDMVDGIIYSRPLSAEELHELIAMRGRIEKERGDLGDPLRDFKTGAGGLVDVEFLAQAQQLRHGLRHPELRHLGTPEILHAMPLVAGWSGEDCRILIEDYAWLRRLENVLRRDTFSSVAQLPSDHAGWNLPARRLGLKDEAALESELATRCEQIRKLTDKHLEITVR